MTKTYDTANLDSNPKMLMYGVGFNSGGRYSTREGGKYTIACQTWRDMFRRCYCAKTQARQPTYKDCSIADDWHDFQVFAEWHETHDYSALGYDLDKDLLFKGNKKYSKETCCFVPRALNSLLTNRKAARGDLPQGVCFHKGTGRFAASIRINGKRKHLGLFDCPNEAYKSYKAAKEAYVRVSAIEWKGLIDEKVFNALIVWKLSE